LREFRTFTNPLWFNPKLLRDDLSHTCLDFGAHDCGVVERSTGDLCLDRTSAEVGSKTPVAGQARRTVEPDTASDRCKTRYNLESRHDSVQAQLLSIELVRIYSRIKEEVRDLEIRREVRIGHGSRCRLWTLYT
jgi:hypothetical protein